MISIETIFKRLYYLDKKSFYVKTFTLIFFQLLKQYQYFISDNILSFQQENDID